MFTLSALRFAARNPRFFCPLTGYIDDIRSQALRSPLRSPQESVPKPLRGTPAKLPLPRAQRCRTHKGKPIHCLSPQGKQMRQTSEKKQKKNRDKTYTLKRKCLYDEWLLVLKSTRYTFPLISINRSNVPPKYLQVRVCSCINIL